MPHYTQRLDKVIKGLQKASKTHARQAEVLLKILKDQKHVKAKKRPEGRNRKKTKG